MPKILALSGSIRRDSWNRKLIQAAVDAARAAGGDVTLIDLADYPLPLYNGDLEDRDGLPDNALRLKALFKQHDALLIASPEYNSSIPPLLKNTLDWAKPGVYLVKLCLRQPPPGRHHRIRVQRDRADSLFHQPFGQIGMVARPLAADADIFSVPVAGGNRLGQKLLYRRIAFVETTGN